MSTIENLQNAFAGESQASRKYLAFAKKAEEEGMLQVAKLFRAASEAETVHALAHFRVMGGIKSTNENLQEAIKGEEFEFTEMYPDYLVEAQQEGNKPAEFSIKNALAVEEIHHGLYAKALEAVKGGRDLPSGQIYICPVCGNTVENTIPETCPICNVPGGKFIEIR